MSKLKKVGIIILCIVVVNAISIFCGIYFGNRNWPVRFEQEFNQFFGAGNWKCIQTEANDSKFFSRSTRTAIGHEIEDGIYRNWDIEFKNIYGETKECRVTNHGLLINHSKNWIFTDDRRTSKQGMIEQLYGIASTYCVNNDVIKNIMKEYMTNEMIACFSVSLSDQHGYPDPEDYSTLFEQEWFNIQEVTLEDFLQFQEHEYYLDIFMYDNRYDELSVSDQQVVLEAIGQIETALLDKYGSDASFALYFDEGYQVEYQDGVVVLD